MSGVRPDDGDGEAGGPALVLRDVTKRYAGAGAAPVDALRGVSLTVRAGERVAIMGASGSGKSTLLHVAGALDSPTSGTVAVAGRALASLSDAALTRLRRDRIGFVFQSFQLLPTLSALENVMLPALLGGTALGDARARAEERLAAVGLSARRDQHVQALSGGEMQRVAIARALLLDPPLLLADEPTGNLDSRSGDQVLELLLGEAAARRALVIVTHDARLAARADRIVRLRDGELESE